MSTLLPCSCCNRHVRQGTTVCPFCAEAPRLAAPSPPPPGPAPRLAGHAGTRAALLFAGATLLAAGCGSASSEPAPTTAGAPTTESTGSEQSPEPIGESRAEEPPTPTPDATAPEEESVRGEGQLVPMYGTPN